MALCIPIHLRQRTSRIYQDHLHLCWVLTSFVRPYMLRSFYFLQSDIGLGSLPIMPPALLQMVFCSGIFPVGFIEFPRPLTITAFINLYGLLKQCLKFLLLFYYRVPYIKSLQYKRPQQTVQLVKLVHQIYYQSKP